MSKPIINTILELKSKLYNENVELMEIRVTRGGVHAIEREADEILYEPVEGETLTGQCKVAGVTVRELGHFCYTCNRKLIEHSEPQRKACKLRQRVNQANEELDEEVNK